MSQFLTYATNNILSFERFRYGPIAPQASIVFKLVKADIVDQSFGFKFNSQNSATIYVLSFPSARAKAAGFWY